MLVLGELIERVAEEGTPLEIVRADRPPPGHGTACRPRPRPESAPGPPVPGVGRRPWPRHRRSERRCGARRGDPTPHPAPARAPRGSASPRAGSPPGDCKRSSPCRAGAAARDVAGRRTARPRQRARARPREALETSSPDPESPSIALGKSGHRRLLEEDPDGQRHVVVGPNAGHESHGEQRVPAQLEEVVPRPYARPRRVARTQSAATARSVSVAGSTKALDNSRRSASTSGSAERSSFPLGVRGSASARRTTDGTM